MKTGLKFRTPNMHHQWKCIEVFVAQNFKYQTKKFIDISVAQNFKYQIHVICDSVMIFVWPEI